jgi:hypothetical protein
VVQRPQQRGAAVAEATPGQGRSAQRQHVRRGSAESAAVRSRGEESETVIGSLGNATLGNTRLLNDRTWAAKAQPRDNRRITSDDAPGLVAMESR